MMEVVLNPFDSIIEYFCMPWESKGDSIKQRII